MLKPVLVEPILQVQELYTLYGFHREKGYVFAGESHNFWEIVYVDNGTACGINGTQPYTLQKGQLIFHRPGAFHNLRTGDDGDCDILVLSFQGQLELLQTFSEQIFTLTLKEKRLLKEMMEEGSLVYRKPAGTNLIYQKNAPHSPELTPGAKQTVRNLLELLLISLYRKQQNCSPDIQPLSLQSLSPEYALVKQVVTFLDENLYNNISFCDVAGHFNCSETQLKKMFREVTGYSVMQYYRKSVVGRIEYHIRQLDRNFTEIADLFHFSSLYYFSKFYKRETGHTPREYLKNSRQP